MKKQLLAAALCSAELQGCGAAPEPTRREQMQHEETGEEKL